MVQECGQLFHMSKIYFLINAGYRKCPRSFKTMISNQASVLPEIEHFMEQSLFQLIALASLQQL